MYSENLKIVLVDAGTELVSWRDETAMKIIRDYLCKPQTHIMYFIDDTCTEPKEVTCEIAWTYVPPRNEPESQLTGDLFLKSVYSTDIVYEHTKRSIALLEKNLDRRHGEYDIRFHISRVFVPQPGVRFL